MVECFWGLKLYHPTQRQQGPVPVLTAWNCCPLFVQWKICPLHSWLHLYLEYMATCVFFLIRKYPPCPQIWILGDRCCADPGLRICVSRCSASRGTTCKMQLTQSVGAEARDCCVDTACETSLGPDCTVLLEVAVTLVSASHCFTDRAERSAACVYVLGQVFERCHDPSSTSKLNSAWGRWHHFLPCPPAE